jgi:hypothetical protein
VLNLSSLLHKTFDLKRLCRIADKESPKVMTPTTKAIFITHKNQNSRKFRIFRLFFCALNFSFLSCGLILRKMPPVISSAYGFAQFAFISAVQPGSPIQPLNFDPEPLAFDLSPQG